MFRSEFRAHPNFYVALLLIATLIGGTIIGQVMPVNGPDVTVAPCDAAELSFAGPTVPGVCATDDGDVVPMP